MAIYSVNNSNDRFTLQLTLTEGAYSIANNTSPVTYTLELKSNGSWNFETYSIGRKVVLNGSTVYEVTRANSGKFNLGAGGKITLASGTTSIQHEADGSKKISVAYSIDMAKADWTPGSLSGTGEFEMVTIPRQAIITTAPNFTDEQNPTIEYNNMAGELATSLMACISFDGSKDDVTYRDIPLSGTSYTFELTDEEREILRNGTSGNARTVKFFIRTILGNSNTNLYSTADRTLSIVNANPTFTVDQVTYEDTNENVTKITGNPQHIVQNQSSLTVTLGEATGNKGASIVDYTLVLNEATKTVTENGNVEYGLINSSQNLMLSVTVKDSRGNTTTVKKEITVLEWAIPTFTASLERLNNYEDKTHLIVDASISSVNNKNTPYITYRKKVSGGEYGSPVEIENNTLCIVDCDKNYAYTVEVTVADAFNSASREYSVAKGKFPLFIDIEKNAVGINDFPAENEALRVRGGIANFESISVFDDALTDFIVDRGTDGIWTYEKHLSGKVVCWGTVTETIGTNLAYGSGYIYSGSLHNLPTNLFKEIQYINASCLGFRYGDISLNTVSITGISFHYKFLTSYTGNNTAYAYIIGTWK